jgi:predicted Kef-type K+ transport protein
VEPAFLIAALIGGLAAMAVRLPPLVGFLAAGFVLRAMDYENTETLQTLADLGVTVLLFTIGLKLNIRTLSRAEVWGTASVHMVASTGLIVGILAAIKLLGLSMLAATDGAGILIIAFALSFSSTVFAVKVLEDRGEARSLYGRISIGILVMQDIFAVIFLVVATAELPSPYALLLIGLIPLAPVLRHVLQRVGRGEMQVLLGVAMALVLGYTLFEQVGIKGDLGALILGMLLAPSPAAESLSKSLFAVKELLLVGFFLSIGLTAVPTLQTFGMAVLVVVLVPVKAALFMAIFAGFKLRWRTATLASLSLATFSEFGLIVESVAADKGWLDEQWLVVLSMAIAMSFVWASIGNARNETIYAKFTRRLSAQDPKRLHPRDQPIQIGDAQAVVIGMGRVGEGAYERLSAVYGLRVLGIESNDEKVRELRERGIRVVEGDADDTDFWDKLCLTHAVELIVLAMPHHQGNGYALDELQKRQFGGRTAAVVQHRDQIDKMRERGADAVFHVYAEAGQALADNLAEVAGLRPSDSPPAS